MPLIAKNAIKLPRPNPKREWSQKDIDLTNAFEGCMNARYPVEQEFFEKEGTDARFYYKDREADKLFKIFKAGVLLTEFRQINLKEVADAEFAKGYETAKQEMTKEQALNPLDQAKLELIKAKIEVEKAKFEQIKKATNPLVLPSEAVEAGI